MADTIHVRVGWESTHELDVPDGMTREEAVDAFNRGEHDRFEDYDNSGASVLTWEAS